jgi:hypothetical protein
MMLRAIELANVRRFAGKRARIAGIGDGITVMSEPNEFGKSTFFDAIHAVFFERHNGRNAAIKALQPHAGGAPEVVIEVDLPEGRFRIMKRWLAKPQAQISDTTGRLIAQADEAEAWIDRLMGGGLAGPSGLLWVRQGLMGLESDDKRERDRDLSARRDLMSSVAGEIDMMTGGRRMDAVIDRVAEALARLATSTGRPKAGGEWARAVDEAATLGAEEADLRPRAARLSSDLARRADVQRNLARLTDPTDTAARAKALSEAEAAHQTTLAHQAEVEKAETALSLARMDAGSLQHELAAAEALAARVNAAQATLAKANEAATDARARADDLGQRDRAATETASVSSSKARDLRLRLQAANRAQSARAAKAQAKDLQRRLDRATVLQTTLDQTRAARARIAVTARLLEAADKAQSALDLARARTEAQAVTVEARSQNAPALLNGAPLPASPVPILSAVNLILPGFGTLHIDPGAARSRDTITQADQALARVLAEADADSLSAARARWAEAQRLDADVNQATALLAEVAPEGLDTLRTALVRALADAIGATDAAEDSASLATALSISEAEEQSALAAAKAAQSLAVQAGEARAAADANRASAERQFSSASAEAGDPAALAGRIADLKTRAPALHETAARAEQALGVLRSKAPDLATTEARLARAKGAVDQARAAEQKAREELASLNATILALAEEGIEERLSILSDQRAAAEARAVRYEAEVKALSRLRRALDEARTKARDAYFGPVLRELQPLLAILYPGAQLTIDDASLLPATLTRNGQAEDLDVLSGGTREQVAILTRLAFARLFATAGRPIPVILDDALVHSDDDRIEAMFDALHRTARDQQILVLTCRQRAFAALGGERAEVTVEMI